MAHHWRALEFMSRHSAIDIDPLTFSQFAAIGRSANGPHESGAGINCYLNRIVKLLSDYEYMTSPAGIVNITHLPTERLIMTRVQLMF